MELRHDTPQSKAFDESMGRNWPPLRRMSRQSWDFFCYAFDQRNGKALNVKCTHSFIDIRCENEHGRRQASRLLERKDSTFGKTWMAPSTFSSTKNGHGDTGAFGIRILNVLPCQPDQRSYLAALYPFKPPRSPEISYSKPGVVFPRAAPVIPSLLREFLSHRMDRNSKKRKL